MDKKELKLMRNLLQIAFFYFRKTRSTSQKTRDDMKSDFIFLNEIQRLLDKKQDNYILIKQHDRGSIKTNLLKLHYGKGF